MYKIKLLIKRLWGPYLYWHA